MEFESAGYQLRAQKLSAFEQLHLSRKIAPLLPPLAPLLAEHMQGGTLLDTKILALAELAEPFALALASLSDEAAEQVMTLALSKVQVMTDPAKNVWVPLWVPAARRAMVEDLNDLGALMPIVVKIILFNLRNFIDGLLMRQGKGSPAAPSGAASPDKKIG